MDNVLDHDFESQDLGISGEAKGYLETTAKWAKFLAIVGFVSLGLMVIMGLFAGTFMSMTAMDELGVGGGAFIVIFYLIFAVIFFFPTLYLYRFAIQTQDAIRVNNMTRMTEAFKNLKSMFKFMGIFTAIILGFYVLAIIIMILGVAAAG